jgi:hypothetical protein
MAEDLRNEQKAIKRRIKYLERKLAKLKADPVGEGQRLFEAEARRRRTTQLAIASGELAGLLKIFLPTAGRHPGRPVKLNSARRELNVQMSKLPYDLAAGKSARKIARLLGASDNDQYKHQQVSELIRFVMENFTRRMPGESRKSQSDRTLDIILRAKLEE